MSGAKFYVLGGGRWRELDISAGRVEGWGAARFLFVERGRLRAERRAPVLRGLRALAAGRARTARDGAPLSQIRHTKAAKEKHSHCERHAHCQHAYYGCGVNAQFNVQLPGARAQHAAVQADLPRDRDHARALSPHAKKSRGPVRNVAYKSHNNNVQKKSTVKNKQSEINVPHRNNVMLTSSDEDLRTSIKELNRKRKIQELRGAELCKELIIAEEDILLLRNYIEKDEKNLFNVDLERFDADDTYKSKVFYKLNPLVNVERCKAIADMTWEQQSQSTVTLKDFITNLGLRRVDDPWPSPSRYKIRKRGDARKPRESGSEQDKENLASKRQPEVKKRPNKVLGESVGGKANSDRVKGKVKSSNVTTRATRGPRRLEESVVVEVSDSDDAFERTEAAEHRNRAVGGAGREYSPAEDAAIVRWLRVAGRAYLVNGNRLWRELQPEHRRLTGHFRSWHSLRNRYLRYVLPALGELLSPPAATALRAAAARGKIKRRPQRHELLKAPPVLSAWARRPRPPLQPETPSDTARRDGLLHNVSEPTRSLRSSDPSAAPAHADTYEDLTKRFAERHRSTPNSNTSEVSEPEKIERRASKRLRAGGNVDLSIRLEDVSRQTDTSGRRPETYNNDADTSNKRTTRSTRHSDRSKRIADTSSRHTDDRSQTTDSTDRRKPRTRRLYNHNL